MKYTEKANRYLEINRSFPITNKEEYQKLRRELYIRGFQPQRLNGLIERCTVYDLRGSVRAFCDVARHTHGGHIPNSTTYQNLADFLKNFGITNLDYHHLESILANIETNRRQAESKSDQRQRKTKPARELANHLRSAFDAELALLESEADNLGLDGDDRQNFIDEALAGNV